MSNHGELQCLELIYADLCEPMRTTSFSESKYFLMFTDDFSGMT